MPEMIRILCGTILSGTLNGYTIPMYLTHGKLTLLDYAAGVLLKPVSSTNQNDRSN
jgi:hypothetical protein